MLRRPITVCTLACGRPAALGGLAGAPTSSSAPTSLVAPLVVDEQRRFLKFAKSEHGFKLHRKGNRNFPAWRAPLAHSTRYLNKLHPRIYWKYAMPKHPNMLLPRSNFVLNGMTGHFGLPKTQFYTLQHTTATCPIRVKRYPTFYTFTNPSRWTVGSRLQTWVLPRALIVDEVAISKKQRLVYVKLGLINE